MGRIAAYAWRTAIARGLMGGNRTWFAVFAAIGTAKVLRRLSGSIPETVYQAKLEPGHGLVITHLAGERLGDTPER